MDEEEMRRQIFRVLRAEAGRDGSLDSEEELDEWANEIASSIVERLRS